MKYFSLFTILFMTQATFGQTFQANYDEAKVPKYMLPELLVANDGSKITTADDWAKKRRPEVLNLFEEHMFGKAPGRPNGMTFDVISIDKNALGGKAVRKEVAIYFTGKKDGPKMTLLMYLPRDAKGKVPVFLVPNFNGNHAVHLDPAITLSPEWMRPGKGVVKNKATPESRGSEASRFSIDDILSRGYGLATFYYGDLDPDYDDGWKNGIHPTFFKSGQTKPAPHEWGSIGAWAWGCSRALDYLETDADVDATKVIVLGHSRLGKTALWAGVTDQRFAIVISNNSGCGGVALSRRAFGETVFRINTSFPHWFCSNFHKYNNKEAELPLDQHMLIALAAPRPIYVASAVEDKWADPRGEFLSAKLAEPVYRLYGKEGLKTDDLPALNTPVMGSIGYHIREGKHDVRQYDWQRYLDFAEKHLK